MGIPNIKSIFESTSIIRILISIALFLCLNISIRWISSSAESTLSTFTFIQRTVIASIVRPIIFLLSHIIYFGPIILLIVFNWSSFCDVLVKYGIGLFIFVLLSLFLSLNSESRAVIASFPFFVIILINSLENRKFPYWFYWVFIVISIIFSKVWLPLGNVNFDGGYFRLPYQWYFMNYGPWISNQMYILQGVITIISALFIYLLFKKNIKKNDDLNFRKNVFKYGLIDKSN